MILSITSPNEIPFRKVPEHIEKLSVHSIDLSDENVMNVFSEFVLTNDISSIHFYDCKLQSHVPVNPNTTTSIGMSDCDISKLDIDAPLLKFLMIFRCPIKTISSKIFPALKVLHLYDTLLTKIPKIFLDDHLKSFKTDGDTTISFIEGVHKKDKGKEKVYTDAIPVPSRKQRKPDTEKVGVDILTNEAVYTRDKYVDCRNNHISLVGNWERWVEMCGINKCVECGLEMK